jgi:hypothetical protein
MAFACYLNPPPPPPAQASPAVARSASQPAPPAPVTPKFNLVGTSFYATRPELSLALIDEPGKGFNWVRQGSSVGHLTIEQIKDGSITIKDSQGSSEMAVTVSQPWRTLLKNPPPETQPASTDTSHIGPAAAPTTGTGTPPRPTAPHTAVRGRPGFAPKTAPQAGIQPASPPVVESVPPDVEITSPAIKEQEAKIDRLSMEIYEISENRISGDQDAKYEELSKLVEELEKMKAAELLARQKSDSTDQTNANASSDANE